MTFQYLLIFYFIRFMEMSMGSTFYPLDLTGTLEIETPIITL